MKPLLIALTLSFIPHVAHAKCDGRGLASIIDLATTACAEEAAKAPEEPKPAKKMETAGDIAGLDEIQPN